MNLEPKQKTRPLLPAGLADVALVDGPAVAAAAGISISHFHELARREDAPQPLRFGPRCTRYRVSDVREWLIERARKAAADTDIAAKLRARATTASHAARSKRTGTAAAIAE